MKRLIAACMLIALALFLGCGNSGNKSDNQKGSKTEFHSAKKGSLLDPVDGKPVNLETSEYSYIYKDTEYHFNSKDNYDKFKADPGKYVEE